MVMRGAVVVASNRAAAGLYDDTTGPLLVDLLVSLGFACVGFLPFNLRSGKDAAVFMGDGGSQLLGFVVGLIGLKGLPV